MIKPKESKGRIIPLKNPQKTIQLRVMKEDYLHRIH